MVVPRTVSDVTTCDATGADDVDKADPDDTSETDIVRPKRRRVWKMLRESATVSGALAGCQLGFATGGPVGLAAGFVAGGLFGTYVKKTAQTREDAKLQDAAIHFELVAFRTGCDGAARAEALESALCL